ncbi:MAG: flagellar biosynthesis protein [Pseudohongiellaceae bacterium]|jgi:flagellar biosynthesis protein
MDAEDFKQAVALFYDGESAPTITAKGQGTAAEEIIAIARANDVTLCENEPLLELLMSLELGDHIPQSLYIAIAQIVAFAYHLQGKDPANNP